MNKYHRHKSVGLKRPNYKAKSKLRCPNTDILLDATNSKRVVYCNLLKRILQPGEVSTTATTKTVHCLDVETYHTIAALVKREDWNLYANSVQIKRWERILEARQ